MTKEIEETLAAGEQAYAAGQTEVAEHCFRHILVQDGAHPAALNNMGVVLHSQGDLEAAERMFLKATVVGDDLGGPLLNLASIAEARGHIPEAVRYLERYLQLVGETEEVLHEIRRLARAVESQAAGRAVAASPAQAPEASAVPPVPAESAVEAGPAPPIDAKVLMGTMEIANQMHTLTREMQRRGVQANTLSYYRTFLGYEADFEYPVADEKDPATRMLATTRIALDAIDDYDVFHFWFATSMTLDHSDLPILRNLGKRVFMEHNGSDVRTLEAAKRHNKYAACKPIDPAGIQRHLQAIAASVRTAITPAFPNTDFFAHYYDKTHVVPNALDMSKWTVATEHEQNERPLVVHAPTSRDFKGSEYVIRAVAALKRKGLDFDFQLVEGMNHEQARAIYRRADVIVDQLRAGHHGTFAVEGMAMGKPVMVWISDWARQRYPDDLAVWVANPDTVEAELEKAVCDADLRVDMGRRARLYAEKYHDVRHVAGHLFKIYSGVGIDGDKVQLWW